MTARSPFSEAVHPIPSEPIRHTLACPRRGGTGWLCGPGTEPETAARMHAMGFRDTFADALDDSVSVVWGREWRP